jgi:hypothetical protein
MYAAGDLALPESGPAVCWTFRVARADSLGAFIA